MYAIFGKNIRDFFGKIAIFVAESHERRLQTTRFGKSVREIKDCADGSLSRHCAKGVHHAAHG